MVALPPSAVTRAYEGSVLRRENALELGHRGLRVLVADGLHALVLLLDDLEAMRDERVNVAGVRQDGLESLVRQLPF